MRLDWKKIVKEDVKKALDFYRSQGTVPTLRTIYYRLFSLGIFPNTTSSYNTLSDRTARARENGILPINCFGDRTRVVIGNYRADFDYQNPEDHIDDLINELKNIHYYYRPPRWYNQPHHVEIWSEKQAMSPTFESIVYGKEVNIVSNKGYSSVTFLNANCNRLKKLQELGRKIHILYFGDYDPSGENIEEVITKKIAEYGVYDIDFKRIAITLEQIREFHLPQRPDVETLQKLRQDPRAAAFMSNHGGELFQVEVDALYAYRPQDFVNMVLNPINRYFDNEIYEDFLERHSSDRISAFGKDSIGSNEKAKKMSKNIVNENVILRTNYLLKICRK